MQIRARGSAASRAAQCELWRGGAFRNRVGMHADGGVCAAGSCAVCSDLRQLSSFHSCSGSGEIESVLLDRITP